MRLSVSQFSRIAFLTLQFSLFVSAVSLSQEIYRVKLNSTDGYYTAISSVVFFKNGSQGLSNKNKETLSRLISKLHRNNSLTICVNNSSLNKDFSDEEDENSLYDTRKQCIVDYLVENRVPLRKIFTNSNDFLFRLMDSDDQIKNTYATFSKENSYYYFQIYLLDTNNLRTLQTRYNGSHSYIHESCSGSIPKKRKKQLEDQKIDRSEWKSIFAFGRILRQVDVILDSRLNEREQEDDWSWELLIEESEDVIKQQEEKPTKQKDSDGDGVPDTEDRCPNVVGSAANNGCPLPPPTPISQDKDYDGVSGADDLCPNIPGPKEFHGCPNSDGDGIHSKNDKPTKTSDTALNTSKTIQPTLAYHYPRKIKQREQKFIFAHVNLRHPTVVKNELVALINEEITISNTDDTVVQTISIKPFKFLTVTLKDNDHVFSIDTSFQKSRQEIDTINGNTWRWQISTETTKDTAKLVILAKGEMDQGQSETVKPKEIPIAISLDYSFWNETITFLRRNSEYFIGTILLPFIIFLGKKFFDEKKPKDPKTT